MNPVPEVLKGAVVQNDDEEEQGLDTNTSETEQKQGSASGSSRLPGRFVPAWLKKVQTRRFTYHDREGVAKLGGKVFHKDLLRISNVKSSSSSLGTLLALILIILMFILPAFVIPKLMTGDYPGTKPALMPPALGFISVLPAIVFLQWIRMYLNKALDYKAKSLKERKGVCQKIKKLLTPSVAGICIPLGMMFRQSRYFAAAYIPKEFMDDYISYLNRATAMCMFTGWVSILDDFHCAFLTYARRIDSIATGSPKSIQWHGIMYAFSTFGDAETDEGYGIPGGNRSAARVLSEIIGIYCNIGKLLGFIMLVLFFLGVDLYSSLVSLGLTVVFAGIVSALHVNDAFRNLLPLAVSNAIHVGEIISISRAGAPPGDNPKDNLTGFVEGFTWGHVVIRDFKKKQTFIPHEKFGSLTIHNWSRRPTKHAVFKVPIVAELSGGANRLAMLAKFTRQWIKVHPEIDQNAYQKAEIKLGSTGLYMEVIFFPLKGAKIKPIRAEFIVMVMDAAKRYDLCLMPAEIRRSSAWSESKSNDEGEEDFDVINLGDLLPSSGLTVRAGYKPKTA